MRLGQRRFGSFKILCVHIVGASVSCGWMPPQSGVLRRVVNFGLRFQDIHDGPAVTLHLLRADIMD